jgi:hypothetical protein
MGGSRPLGGAMLPVHQIPPRVQSLLEEHRESADCVSQHGESGLVIDVSHWSEASRRAAIDTVHYLAVLEGDEPSTPDRVAGRTEAGILTFRRGLFLLLQELQLRTVGPLVEEVPA